MKITFSRFHQVPRKYFLVCILILACISLFALIPRAFAATYTFDFQFGGPGTENSQFANNRDVVTDSDGNIYVLNTHDTEANIKKFDSAGNYITEFGSYGTDPGQFLGDAVSLAIDSSNNIYLTDSGTQRVEKFTSSGVFVTQWGVPDDINNPQPGELLTPWGIAVYGNNVYVSDQGRFKVIQYTTAGDYVTEWGSQGSGNGQFEFPGAVATDSEGNVFVSDFTNINIQKFSSNGTYQSQWGVYSDTPGNGEFLCIRDIAVSSDDRFFALDNCAYTIQEFDTSGTWVGSFGEQGSGPGQFGERVLGIWATQYKIFVSDGGDYTVAEESGYNDRIEVFTIATEPTPTPTPTPTPSTSNMGSNSPWTNTPVCGDAKPGMISNLSASFGPGPGQITLFWSPPQGLFSGHTISYSDNPSTRKWGITGIGKIPIYTVSHLNPSTKYYFWVNALNNCMPADQLGPVSADAGIGSLNIPPDLTNPGLEVDYNAREDIEELKNIVEEAPEPSRESPTLTLFGKTIDKTTLLIVFGSIFLLLILLVVLWERLSHFKKGNI